MLRYRGARQCPLIPRPRPATPRAVNLLARPPFELPPLSMVFDHRKRRAGGAPLTGRNSENQGYQEVDGASRQASAATAEIPLPERAAATKSWPAGRAGLSWFIGR